MSPKNVPYLEQLLKEYYGIDFSGSLKGKFIEKRNFIKKLQFRQF